MTNKILSLQLNSSQNNVAWHVYSLNLDKQVHGGVFRYYEVIHLEDITMCNKSNKMNN